MNPEAEGTVYPEIDFVVEPARVEAFRAVFGQADGVPPTFLTAAEFTAIPRIIGDPALDLDFTRVLHGGQEYELARPLREGETLTVRPRIESIRVRAGTGFLVIAMDLFDAAGEPVARTRSTMIERSPT
ncbi:MAG TPA: MaoC family dehydratase N-terminal domain-containing protein [Actinomycetota bacterium]|nr:MaoC family dehydratase N-terminal domain-containing protein [Actinomycetota bacterium]